jgi:hypothetical protein
MSDLHYVPYGMVKEPAVYLIAIDFASSIKCAEDPACCGEVWHDTP